MDWVQMNMAVCEALGLHPAGITELNVSLSPERAPEIQATFQVDENAPVVRYRMVPMLDAPAPVPAPPASDPDPDRTLPTQVNPWAWPDPPRAQSTTVTNGA